MSKNKENLEGARRVKDYSGSPLPLVFFVGLSAVLFFAAFYYFPLLWSFFLFPAGLFVAMLIPTTIAINKEWEEAIILRFGKYKRLVGPGLFFKWPFAEVFLKQDLRIINLEVARQEVMTKDNISVSIDAVVFAKVVNTKDSLINIRNVWGSVVQYAQTSMKDLIGNVELDEVLQQRDEIAERIRSIVDRETSEWGIDIFAVNLQNIELPVDMKRVIARQAEAEREKRAVIIKSQGEMEAAVNLEQAVAKMSNRALYLRTLSSLEDISFDQSNTIVFAIPLDVTRGEIIGLTGLAEAIKIKKKVA